MSSLSQFITSALYVTFCTASIGFGALYYRKVVDQLSVKEVHLGEEIALYFDPKAFVGIGVFAFFFCIFVLILSLKTDLTHEEMNMSAPGLVLLVVPMVLVVNALQLYLRAKWQRTSVRTGGILIRRMLSERMDQVAFTLPDLHVRVDREFLWFVLRFRNANGSEISHCSLSPHALIRVVHTLRRSTDWVIQSADVDIDDLLVDDTSAY